MDVNELAISLNNLKTTVESTDSKDKGVEEEDRQQLLQAELDQIRQTNDVIEGMIESIEKTSSHLDVVLTTTQNVDKLLDMWTRILSQTEHTQRLLFNHSWQGLARDDELHEQRQEMLQRKLEVERQELERKKKLEEQRLKKEQELAEKRRQKEETMQRRIYGRKGPTTTITQTRLTTTKPTTKPSSISSLNSARAKPKTTATANANTSAMSRIKPPSTSIRRTK
jgi:hypothetical protein